MNKEERITRTSADQIEDAAEVSLRPQVLEEYIGQKNVTDNLKIFIEAAKQRKDSLDHVLFYGPPGLGPCFSFLKGEAMIEAIDYIQQQC